MTTIVSRKLDQSLADMMRLATKKEGGAEISAKIARGREEMSRLGDAVNSLRSALAKLELPSVARNFTVRGGMVAARSLTLGLTYDADPATDDPSRPLAEVPRFSSVAAGNVRINGVDVAIDPAVDSLNDVAARINASAAGVTATVLRSGDRFELVSAKARTPLIIEEGQTGFFSTLDIAPRTYQPVRSAIDSFGSERALLEELGEISKALESIFKGEFADLDQALLDQLKTGLKDAIVGVVKAHGGNTSGTPMRSGFGVDFDFGFFSKGIMKVDAVKFARSAGEDFDGVFAFIAGNAGKDLPGLAPALIAAFKETLGETVTKIGNTFAAGTLADLKA